MNHPIQAQLWTKLLRVQIGKHWAVDLDVSDSEISRWALGQRAMSMDDLVAVVRVCKRLHREDIGLWLLGQLASEIGGTVPMPTTTPIELALRTGETAGDAARQWRDILADGVVTVDEAATLDTIADQLEELARLYRGTATKARSTDSTRRSPSR